MQIYYFLYDLNAKLQIQKLSFQNSRGLQIPDQVSSRKKYKILIFH